LPAVDAHIDAEGKPGLHPNVHQADFGVLIVMVQMSALGRLHDQAQAFGLTIAADPKGKTGFHTAQQCDSSCLNWFLGQQLLNERFFTELRTWQINLGPAHLLETLIGQFFNPIADALGEALEVLDQHFAVVQIHLRSFRTK
jgi:hypothetical protein